MDEHFYPRSPCGERLAGLREFVLPVVISIHALLAESDGCSAPERIRRPNFYPRSPCGERRSRRFALRSRRNFYPRSPCGERPPQSRAQRAHLRHFYPRSPCGERLVVGPFSDVCAGISIHALLAESDPCTTMIGASNLKFLSTLSLRRATRTTSQRAQRP